MIAGILLVGILAVALAGCKNTDENKKETGKPVITLGSDNYPPYNYLNEDGVPTGIDVELATEAFRRMGYQVKVVQINWEKKKELVESGETVSYTHLTKKQKPYSRKQEMVSAFCVREGL